MKPFVATIVIAVLWLGVGVAAFLAAGWSF